SRTRVPAEPTQAHPPRSSPRRLPREPHPPATQAARDYARRAEAQPSHRAPALPRGVAASARARFAGSMDRAAACTPTAPTPFALRPPANINAHMQPWLHHSFRGATAVNAPTPVTVL